MIVPRFRQRDARDVRHLHLAWAGGHEDDDLVALLDLFAFLGIGLEHDPHGSLAGLALGARLKSNVCEFGAQRRLR